MEIEAVTIAEAHEKVVASIMKKSIGIDIETSPGKWERTWEYPDLITTIIREPWKHPQVSEACNFGPGFIKQYKMDLCTLKSRGEYPKGKEPVYTYPWRLFDYPRPLYNQDTGFFIRGNGDCYGINQVNQIVSRLLENPESRRANMITWVPHIDGVASHDQPCLQVVHVLIRENRLHMRAFFRSHDMLGGAGANWVGMSGLQELIAAKLIAEGFDAGLKIGSLTTCSSSAHLYWKRDQKDLDDFRAHLFKKYQMFLGEE